MSNINQVALKAVQNQVLKEFGSLEGVDIKFSVDERTGKVHYVITRKLARPWLEDVA